MEHAVKLQKVPTLKQMEQIVAKTPEVRQDLVERFRFLVETGRYNVSNRAIAEAMVEDGVLDDVLPSA